MAIENLNPDSDVAVGAGWAELNFADPDNKIYDDITKGSGDDTGGEATTHFGSNYEASLVATSITDADIVTKCEVVMRSKFTAGINWSADVTLKIGGTSQVVTQAITGTLTTYMLNHATWNSDWTQPQLDAATIVCKLYKGGKAVDRKARITQFYLKTTYTPAPSTRVVSLGGYVKTTGSRVVLVG